MQSLKLDTSVWSNEIVQVRSLQRENVCLGVWAGVEGACVKRPWVQPGDRIGMPGDTSFCHLPLLPVTLQLFIVLGNDRANRFWAGSLPPGEGLHPDTTPGPRGEFISRKYRLGLFRKPHPQYPDHSQLLQVGGKAGTDGSLS